MTIKLIRHSAFFLINGLLSVCLFLGLIDQTWALTVTDVKVEELDDRTQVSLQFDQVLENRPGLFRIANPARQVVDFSTELSNKSLPVVFAANSRIKQSQLISSAGKSRLVFEMAQNYDVQVKQSDRSVELVFSGPKPFVPDTAQAAVLPETSTLKETVSEVLGKPAVVEGGAVLIGWGVSEQDGKQLIRIEFDRSEVVADAVLNNERLRLRFANARIKSDVPKQLPTKPDSPIQSLSLIPGTQTLLMQMDLKNATHVVRQSGSVVEVEVTPIAKPVVQASSQPEVQPAGQGQSLVARYSGRPITLDFKDADIRTVMQVFADFTKMNLVLSDSVQGTVSVFLKDVPWDQALDIVMRSKGLISSQSGNVLLVSKTTDPGNDKLEEATRKAKDEMEPLISKSFQISYQKTADLVALIKSADSKLLSSRGTLISDERTSQLFVQDTPTRMERINMIITSLDKPVKQIMIEARVVLADANVSKELGVRIKAASAEAAAFTEVQSQFGKNSFIDLGPESSGTLAYTLFNANSTRLLNLQLRALETDSKVRTVSNPRVITSNKEAALIEQGTEIPYRVATSSGATAIEFKEANLKLAVTPQVSPDGKVLLDVDVSKDAVGRETRNGDLAIDTRRVKTKVLVADGGTVVLGGIFEEDDSNLDEKVPFLGDVPVVGALFRGKTEKKRRAELLIFLTPVVLSDQ